MKLLAAAALAFALAPLATPAFAQAVYAPLAPDAHAPAEPQEPAELPPAPAVAQPNDDCPGCPPPRQYDTFEVIKKIKEIDRSRVINTTTVVPVVRYVPERAPKPEVLYVRPSVTVVNFVTQRYRVTEQPVGFAAVPVQQGPRIKSCRDGGCRPYLRVRG